MVGRMSNLTLAARPGGAAPNTGRGFIQRRKVSKVNTRATPGMAAAASVRMETMRAWACGERRNAACSIPGTTTSST